MNPEKFLDSLVNYEKISGYNYNLKNYKEFLINVGAPQKNLKNVLLIAGTKGKGSTAAILNSCLISHGYKVGLYASPHLEKINERIKVNNINISSNNLTNYISRIKPYIKRKRGVRTFFEVLTTIAFLHFLRERTNFSVLEVGLGGRLDATNVTKPLLSVITKIGYDHTDLLGKRLPLIASEKAGIIKRGSKLVTIHQRPTVGNSLKRITRLRKSSIIFAEDKHTIKIIDKSLQGSELKITGELGIFKAFLPLAGSHQVQNLLLALAVLSELKQMGFSINAKAVRDGIQRTQLHGRFEVISRKPLIVFDGAHNQDSFEALNKNLDLLETKNFSLIFGCKKSKDINYCLRTIFPKAKEVALVPINNPLGMEPGNIYKRAKKYQKNLTIAPSIQKAIQYLKGKATNTSTILITGSFYLWQKGWLI